MIVLLVVIALLFLMAIGDCSGVCVEQSVTDTLTTEPKRNSKTDNFFKSIESSMNKPCWI